MAGCSSRRRRLGPKGIPERKRNGIEGGLGPIGPGQFLFGSLEADLAQRPAEYVIGGSTEKVGAQLEEVGAGIDADDAINIQFTSGTTGQPKAATLTHHNIVNNAYFVGETMELTEQDRLCVPVPFYHCFGMVMGNLGSTTHGATMVIPSDAFDPTAVLEAVEPRADDTIVTLGDYVDRGPGSRAVLDWLIENTMCQTQ